MNIEFIYDRTGKVPVYDVLLMSKNYEIIMYVMSYTGEEMAAYDSPK